MNGSPFREDAVPMSLVNLRWICVPCISWRGSACAKEAARESTATRNRARTKYFMRFLLPSNTGLLAEANCRMGLIGSVTWMHAEGRLVVRRWRADPSSAAALGGRMEEDLQPAISVAKSERKKSEFLWPFRSVDQRQTAWSCTRRGLGVCFAQCLVLHGGRFHENLVKTRPGSRSNVFCYSVRGRFRSGEKRCGGRSRHRTQCGPKVVADHQRMRLGFGQRRDER